MWRWTGGWGCCGGAGLGWWGVLDFLFGLIFLVMAIAAVVWIVRRLSSGNRGAGSSAIESVAPETILKERYARGEITREEYLDMLHDIQGGLNE